MIDNNEIKIETQNTVRTLKLRKSHRKFQPQTKLMVTRNEKSLSTIKASPSPPKVRSRTFVKAIENFDVINNPLP